MSLPRNSAFRYLEDIPVSDAQTKQIETILYEPIDDLSELAQFVEDESADYLNAEDHGLGE